jgi:hypothetical protein
MGIETNLNQNPYFDDFDETKNFHRILFRPGYAVQARELTQLQSILQNQIERFGNQTVGDGTKISGCGLTTRKVDYVKLRDKDANNRVLLLGDFYQSGSVANAIVYGSSTGLQAKLIDVADGSETAGDINGNYLTIFVSYINSGSNNTTKSFSSNESLVIRTNNVSNTFLVAANTLTANATGFGLRASVTDGLVYHKGNFVRVAPQGTIVSKYSTNPDKVIGFETPETIINSDQDSSLLDNATGTTNFSAPGANRLKITPTLAVREVGVEDSNSFFTIALVEDGLVVQEFEDTTKADLGQYIAERIYETNGNFAINPFSIRIREHLKDASNLGKYTLNAGGDRNKLIAEVESGTGYIQGQRVSVEGPKKSEIDKATTYEVKDGRVLTQRIGNYVYANEVVGTWDFQGYQTVSLRNVVQEGITGRNFGNQSQLGTELGTAKIRNIQWHSGTMGTAEAVFRIYLFDIKMNENKSFSDVRSIYVNNASGPKSMADIVLSSDDEIDYNAKLQEPELNTLVFPFTQKGTKTLKDSLGATDTQFVFRTEKTVSFNTSGIGTVSANAAHAGGTETLFDQGPSQIEETSLMIVSKQAVTSPDQTGTIISFGGTAINGSGTDFRNEYDVGELIQITDGSNTVSALITDIENAESMTVANGDLGYTRDSVTLTHRTLFPEGYTFDLNLKGSFTSSSTSHSVDLDRTFSSSFNASVYFNVLRSNAVPETKTVNKGKYVHIHVPDNTAGNFGPWCLGVSDAYKLEEVYMGEQGYPNEVWANSEVVTSNFVIDSGMKDAFYDTSYLRLKPNSTLDLAGRGLLVKFSYFTRNRSNGIGFLSVDSYPIDDANVANTNAITTQEIPIFTSPTSGKKFDLRDSIDFRPIKTNTATPSANGVGVQTPSITNPTASTTFLIDSDGTYSPTPGENFQTDIQFYLPRRDRIVMSKEGAINVVKGVPSIVPKTPPDVAGSMTLAILDIPVYPSLSPHVAKNAKRNDYQVRVNLENNRRYTMRDIRVIDDKIKNLEYYTSLNALETAAKNQQIFGSTGMDRFKNGFLVDNFDGHNIADRDSIGYRAAIDRDRTLLRPTFSRADITLSKDINLASSKVTQKGNLVLIEYTQTEYLKQRFASKKRNPAQEVSFNWKGQIILNPSMDNTSDITTLPEIQLDFDGFYGAIEYIAQETGITGTEGIDWGAWNTVSSSSTVVGQDTSVRTTRDNDWSTTTRTTTTTTQTQSDQIRSGIQNTLSPSTETFSIGPFVENVAVRDFMRSRLIQFTAYGMRPNTRVYPFFDGELVGDYCTPTNFSYANTANEGGSLVTSDRGTVYGVFRIPNDDNLKFRVGTKRFELKDIDDLESESDIVTTSAHGDYTSIGLDVTQRGTSVNIVTPQLSQSVVTDNRTLTSLVTSSEDQVIARNREDDGGDDNDDPMSQTFTVVAGKSDGLFITKLDLFFADKSNSLGITAEIREVDNGYPSNVIVPFSTKTLEPSEVNISEDGQTATTFEFDSPVFLKNNSDYAIIVRPHGGTSEYNVWVGELGGTDVSTGELISRQPASGILFTSANDKAWSPIQSEDLKFTLHKAVFDTSQTSNLYIENDNIDFFVYSTINGTFRNGEKVTNTSGDRGFVSFIDSVNQRIYIENSTGGFADGETITGAKSGATAVIEDIPNFSMNTIVPKIPQVLYTDTQADWEVRATTSSGVITGSYVSVDIGVENLFTDNEKAVFSKTNEDALSAVGGTKKTLVYRGNLGTTDPNVSPVVDTTRLSTIILGNNINNDVSDEHKEVGNALVRYITRPVELAEGNDAEDLKIYLTAYKPSGTDINVYARVHNPEDPEGLSEKDFSPLTQITDVTAVSDSVDTNDYIEFEYAFSANTNGSGFLFSSNSHALLNTSDNDILYYKGKDGSIYRTFKNFAIKIVLTSSNSGNIPLVRDMRSIALQK